MVAYQGDVDFAYEGSGGMAKMFKKALTGEGMALMKVSGSGDVFLAQEADEIFVLELEDEAVTVNGAGARVRGDAHVGHQARRGRVDVSGGLFNTTFTGSGVLAVVAHGTPVVLQVDVPTFVDMQARSCGRRPAVVGQQDRQVGAAIGRGSGEAYQLALAGQGIVVVQASEGHVVETHSH